MSILLEKKVEQDAAKNKATDGGVSQSGQMFSFSKDTQQMANLQEKVGNYAAQSLVDVASKAGVKEVRRGPRSSEEIVELNATIGGVYIAAERIDIADGLLRAYSRNIASRLAAVETFSNFQRQLQEEFPVTSWLVTRFTSDLPESKNASANLAQADISIRKSEYRAAVDFLAMAENEVDQLVKATSGYQESQEIATSRFISGLQGAKAAGGMAVGVLTAGSGVAAVAAVGAGYTAIQEASEQAIKVHLGMMREIDWEGIVVDAIINLAIGKLLAGLSRFSRGKEFAQSFEKVAPWELRKIPEQEIKQFAIATAKYLLSKQTIKEMLHAKFATFLQIILKTGYDSLRNRDERQGFSESIKQKFSGMLFDEKGDVDFQGIFFQALSDALGSATNRAATPLFPKYEGGAPELVFTVHAKEVPSLNESASVPITASAQPRRVGKNLAIVESTPSETLNKKLSISEATPISTTDHASLQASSDTSFFDFSQPMLGAHGEPAHSNQSEGRAPEFDYSKPMLGASDNLDGLAPALKEGIGVPDFDKSGPMLSDPAQALDVDPVPAIRRLKPYKGKKTLPALGKPYERTFGAPSEYSSGTEKRIGMHFGERNAAETMHGLVTSYDVKAGRPNSVKYRVDADTGNRTVQTDRSFTINEATEGAQPSTNDYTNTGYDRGHLAQREAFKGNADAERAADHMDNVVPMHPNLNRGEGSPWRAAEANTIRMADIFGSVTVEVTPIYDANPQRLPNGTPIPKGIHRKVMAPNGLVLQDLTFINH